MAKKGLKKPAGKRGARTQNANWLGDKWFDLSNELLDRGEGFLNNKYPHQSTGELSSHIPVPFKIVEKLLRRYGGSGSGFKGHLPNAPIPRLQHPYNGGRGKPPMIPHYNGPRGGSKGSVSI